MENAPEFLAGETSQGFLPQLWSRVQKHRSEIFWIALLLIVASLSYGIGYLNGRDLTKTPIIIEKLTK